MRKETHPQHNGVNIALFLDDGWLIDIDRNSCAVLAANVRSDLKRASFVTNDEKSQWCPTQLFNGWVLYGMLSTVQFVFRTTEINIAESVCRSLLKDTRLVAGIIFLRG